MQFQAFTEESSEKTLLSDKSLHTMNKKVFLFNTVHLVQQNILSGIWSTPKSLGLSAFEILECDLLLSFKVYEFQIRKL